MAVVATLTEIEANTESTNANDAMTDESASYAPAAPAETIPIPAPASKSYSYTESDSDAKVRPLLRSARRRLVHDLDPDGALDALGEAYGIDPSAPGLTVLFESCLRWRIDSKARRRSSEAIQTAEVISGVGGSTGAGAHEEKVDMEVIHDRFGVASICIDAERYDEASEQLRAIVAALSSDSTPGDEGDYAASLLERASTMLYRTNAACCKWDTYEEDGRELAKSLDRLFYGDRRSSLSELSSKTTMMTTKTTVATKMGRVPALHPFNALKFPCVSLRTATNVAAAYARRAELAVMAVTATATRAREGIQATTRPDEGFGSRSVCSNSGVISSSRVATASTMTTTKIREDIRRKRQWRESPIRVDANAHRSIGRDGNTAATKKKERRKVINVGYISPDFTSKHPLAFLMQDVFRHHDRRHFRVHVYSLSDYDDSPEVRAIVDGSDSFVVLSPRALGGGGGSDIIDAIARRIESDSIDVMIDLCGYAGSSLVSEIMATRRCAPVQVSYMGFPGSTGAPYVDYAVFDPVVVPPSIERVRRHYTESIIYMPHCYFVNSHRACVGRGDDGDVDIDSAERARRRVRYGLPPHPNRDGFVFCCHNRPDKIDPTTFRTWLDALSIVLRRRRGHRRQFLLNKDGELSSSSSSSSSSSIALSRMNGADAEIEFSSVVYTDDDDDNGAGAVLWLLRSGPEMESNLRTLARAEYGRDVESALRFCDVAPRDEHLDRLRCADLFLDTPAYNAHTLGCDALWAGVPMVSLLCDEDYQDEEECEDADGMDGDGNRDEEWMVAATTAKRRDAVSTEKLASRVGASLLRSVGLGDDMICSDMESYRDLMVRCATDHAWFDGRIRPKLRRDNRGSSPLFDTKRWVRNLEAGLECIVDISKEVIGTEGDEVSVNRMRRRDIWIVDDDC